MLFFKSALTLAALGFSAVQCAAVPASTPSIKTHEDAVRLAQETTDDLTAFLDKSLQTATNAAISKIVSIVFPNVDFDIAGVLDEQIDPLEHAIVLQAAPQVRDDIVHFLDDVLQKRTNVSRETLGALARTIEKTIVFESKEAVRDWRDTELQRLIQSILSRIGAGAKKEENSEEKIQARFELLSSSTEGKEPSWFAARRDLASANTVDLAEVLPSWSPNAHPIYVEKSLDTFPKTSYGVRPVTAGILVSLAISVLAAVVATAILGVISYLDILISLKPLLALSETL